jgi:membrane protease YdiL (CAAX protease family)
MDFIQQAFKGKNEWWRYLVGFLIIFIFWQIIGAIPFLVTAVLHSSDLMEFQSSAASSFSTLGINKNLMLAMMLLTGVFGVIAIKYVVKLLHKRSFISVITARKNIDWKRLLFAFILIFGIQAITLLLAYGGDSSELIWNFKPMPFLILVIISFLLFPFQIGTEELLFRGYLMQGIGVGSKSKLIALIITSVLFGLVHGANPEVAALGFSVMIFYIGTGLLYGISTLMDDGMELALGMHAANNIAASLFITATWTVMQTDALYIDPSEPSAGIEMYLPVFVIYPIVLFIFSKKYNWTNWKEKLTGKVVEISTSDENYKVIE